jgi:hypothetical protein
MFPLFRCFFGLRVSVALDPTQEMNCGPRAETTLPDWAATCIEKIRAAGFFYPLIDTDTYPSPPALIDGCRRR